MCANKKIQVHSCPYQHLFYLSAEYNITSYSFKPIYAKQEVNIMEKGEILNVVFLCIINVLFMVAGIFLNSVVLISLWKSRQLRKQLCYFMILVLSCFDLAVVTMTHPFLITSTIYHALDEVSEMHEKMRGMISFVLYGFSMTALLTLNGERFLALTCPYFHQRSVTKTKFVCFQAVMTILIVSVSPLRYFNSQIVAVNIMIAIYMSLLLFLFVYANCKMFTIAKSKRSDERVAPSLATSVNNNGKTRVINLKSISTCSLAVGCFFVCSRPQIIYSALRFTSGAPSYDRQFWLFNIWSNTSLSINSTLNCLIFFWRNTILHREGIKIINACRAYGIN